MIQTLKKIWKHRTGDRPEAKGHDVSLAVSALMVQVMQMDGKMDDAEREEIVSALRDRFDLDEDEAEALIHRATKASGKAHDLYQFTSRIIKEYPIGERAGIIRELWGVAMADGHIDPYEEHLIRRTARLIGVQHRQFISAKIAARKGARHE